MNAGGPRKTLGNGEESVMDLFKKRETSRNAAGSCESVDQREPGLQESDH
jgi:hypothetical protein